MPANFRGITFLNKPVIVSEEALVAPVVVPDVRRRRGQGDGAGLCRARRHQRFALPQRHHAVADPVGVSDPEGELCARLRADRTDHAGVPVHSVAAAAGGRPSHRPQGAAVFARHRHGLHVLRPAAAQRRAELSRHPDRGGAGRIWFGGVPSGIGADRAAGFGRALRLRAVGVSGRRQFGLRDGSGAGGLDRGAVRAAQHRLVFPDRISGNRDPVADRALVPAADLDEESRHRSSRIRTRRVPVESRSRWSCW